MSTVTIASVVIPQWQYGGSTAKLRIFLGTAFVSSAGIPLQSGAPGGLTFYKDVTITISGTDATIASLTIDSTTDGLDIQSARYSAFFFNSAGQRLKSYEGFSNFAVGPNPASTTWAEIRDFNFALQPNRDFTAYTKEQSDRRYATLGSGAPAAAKFIIQTANASLTGAQVLGSLATGLLKNTTTTGALSIAVSGTDYEAGLSFSAPLSRSVNTISLGGPYTPTTYTANGVLYGAAGSSIVATAAGATNSLLQAVAGVPTFTPTPTVDRFTINPAAVSYDLVANNYAYGLTFGSGLPASPTVINVPVSKQLSALDVALDNSGQGKLFLIELNGYASGVTQDAGSEPVRCIIGRASNSHDGKTSFMRIGASGTGTSAASLFACDADVTVVATTNVLTSVFSASVFGTADDVSSGYMVTPISNARMFMALGSIVPVKISSAFVRAWMATGSIGRAFQVLNNSGVEVGYIDANGGFGSGLAGTQLGSFNLSGNTSGVISILPQAAAGTYNFNLPTGAGSSGQPLLSAGGGSSPMTFGTLGATGGGTGLATATQGDLLYASAANTYSALAKNASATRYLSNTGTSNNPAWAQVDLSTGVTNTLPQTAVDNLGMVRIKTVTASAQATVDFVNGVSGVVLDSTYDSYEIRISNCKVATDDVEFWLRIGTGGTPTYQATGYVWGNHADIIGAAFNTYGTGGASGTASTTAILLSETGAGTMVGNATGENWSGVIKFNGPAATDFMEIVFDGQYSRSSANQTVRMLGGGRWNTAGAVTAIRFLTSSGNIASGTFSLYGHRKS